MFAVFLVALQLLLLCMLVDEAWVLMGYARKRSLARRAEPDKATRVTFLIAAHNEADAIGGLIASIQQQSWPAEHVEIWLVADRCHDETASVAARAGAWVWERTDCDDAGKARPIGKGHALQELLQLKSDQRNATDGFIILDADVRLDANYLVEMLRVYAAGYPVVQGASLTKSPKDSSLAQVNSLANRVQHIVQQGRFALGLPNLIIGNTLLVDRCVMERLNWQLVRISPTEEEIKIPLVQLEIPIGYAADALVVEESVHSVKDLARQRSRWFRDYILFLCCGGVPLLLGSIVGGRWRRAEAALAHFWLTSHTLELMLFTFVLVATCLSGSTALIACGLVLWLGKLLVLMALCYAAGVRARDMRRLIISYPGLILGWLGGMLLWLTRPHRSGWSHTQHRG